MTTATEPATTPRVGMFATVRNRRAVIAAVEPHDGPGGHAHLVHVEYKDDQFPVEERLIWELEPGTELLEPTALPNVSASDPMPPEDFDALLRAARWTAMSPYLDPDGAGPVNRLPISSPFHGAVQVEDYQLVPLLKALRMPRVNLLIADDVGLGKTIEAGLILSELLLRRRIQRVLILTPASLRLQWRDEMWEKFSLHFDLVDRAETQQVRRRLGMDANPWRSFSRIITSYHYLRQDDVLEQFMAASRPVRGSAHLPWDLLIVDECHNLMPSAFGDDSDLCRMLRLLAPKFEHRLFLSATPHNGHTRCFTGLLEILDPVRFSQTSELKPAEKARVEQIVLRRLKREINSRTDPPKFCHRHPPKPIALKLSPEEVALGDAFDAFRKAVRILIAEGGRTRRRAGSFAVEILGKRLLSCPTAFAESWKRSKEGLAEREAATEKEVAAAERSVRQDTGDDREAQKREDTAAGIVGSWLKSMAGQLTDEISAIDAAVAGLGIDVNGIEVILQDPLHDARIEELFELIDDLLRDGNDWRDDERLVLFTEYKTTLDYVVRRLRHRYGDDRILTLVGGMNDVERDVVKDAFNNPAHEVRVLAATDAAAEGLNLQRTARYLLHFDCPWNPSKLEQRNGRLDRHGQGRDVTVHYFMSEQSHDLRFLAHVIHKADEIREDLGSANELFDEAAHRRLVAGEDFEEVRRDLDERLRTARGRASFEADATMSTTDGVEASEAEHHLTAIAAEVDLDPTSLRDTLEAAMAIHHGRPQLDCEDDEGICKILNPGLPGWTDVVDDAVRVGGARGVRGPVARLAFDTRPFLSDAGGRLVFGPRPDVFLMHLSHPMLQKALSALTRRRFPGSSDAVSRWTLRRGGVPEGVDALVLLSVEELAVNDLRESFHHWVRTIALPIRNGSLGNALQHVPAIAFRGGSSVTDDASLNRARELLDEVEPDLSRLLVMHGEQLTADLGAELERAGSAARKAEDERYRSRQGEVSALIQGNTMAKLEREVAELKVQRDQGHLFDAQGQLDEMDRSIEDKEREIERRKRHYEEVREQLERERERVLKYLLPRRHTLSGTAHVFPISIEIRLPEGTK